MAMQWSDYALQSLEEIIIWYELEAGRQVADSVQNRIWQQVEKMDARSEEHTSELQSR